jgi:hypothetical protein
MHDSSHEICPLKSVSRSISETPIVVDQGCQKRTKKGESTPNDHKIYQMAIKYTYQMAAK